ncbi:MAG: DUF6353 family protein [Lachnospiraceae bacterium]|nr:DUF6353 family protein [Lachnospiraceae bacterium]
MSIKNAISNLTTSISRSTGMLGLKVQAHSPELLIAGGVVTLIGGVVVACMASRKVDDVIDEHCEAVGDIHDREADETEEIENSESTAEEAETRKKELKKSVQKDLTATYFRTGLKFVKLYAPAVCLIGLSLTCFLSSNNILQKRNVALSSAFTALSQEFSDYRGRVAARFGETAEKEIHYNLESETVDVKTKDKNGKTVTEKQTTYSALSNAPGSMYARYFNKETSIYYKRNHIYNEDFLRLTYENLNNMLIARGYLFLNEVYSELGMPIVDYGQMAGWIYDPNGRVRPSHSDTDVLDLRIQEVIEPFNPLDPDAKREKIWMIDPNVEGNILGYINKKVAA